MNATLEFARLKADVLSLSLGLLKELAALLR